MRNVLAAALALSLLLAGAHARAQDDAERAATLFRDGERAFAHDDYLEALRLFRAAYEAAPHPTVRFHVAMSLERLGRLRDAWSELSEVAATAGLTEAQRRDATRQLERLRTMLVTLRVDGEPVGAGVRVDDAPMCTLPCETPIDPGDHEVSIEDATGRASAHVTGLRGATVAVHLVIEPSAPPDEPAVGAPPSEPPPPTLPPPEDTTEVRHGAGVGWMFVTGTILAAIGAGGVIGFGLHANDVHAAWLDDPTASLRDEGMLFRDLANASIAVLSAGALLAVIDLFLAAAGEGTGDHAAIDPVVRF